MVESTRIRFSGPRRIALLAALCALAWTARPAAAQTRAESEAYPVSAFWIEYALDQAGQPDPHELLGVEVELRPTPTGFVPPHPSAQNVRFALGAVPEGSRFYPGALRQVNRTLVDEFKRRGIGGVLVTLPDLDEKTGRDLRPFGETRLHIVIWTGRVEEVATVADGDRYADLGPGERTNLPQQDWIREGSPVQAGGPDALLRPQEIDDYAAQLSRQAGRRVSPVLRPGALPGATRLEYHVAEQKPWLAYAQISNTGTEATTDRRERFGFSDTQLTGRDDVLNLDYVTGDFDSTQGVFGQYEGPVWRLPRLRWRVDGSWSQYDASEVGLSQLDFKGDEWLAGGRLTANVFQYRDIFVDLFGGLHWQQIGVKNSLIEGGDANDDFFLPQAGLAAERIGEVWSFQLETSVSHNVSSVADTGKKTGNGESELDQLGRLGAEKDFTVLQWHGEASFFVFPLLNRLSWRREAELGPYDFVHELAFMTQGQTSFGDRLVPQFQQIAGGLYTVRGYRQSVAAGDTAMIASAEYRVHLPRLLWPSAEVQKVPWLGSFRLRPENAFSFPDWDLIGRLFVDYGRTIQYDHTAGEHDETLQSFGGGLELRLMRNISARLDLAWPQHRLADDDPSLRKPELHGVLTLLY